MNMMATYWLIPTERPMSNAIAIVVESPGIAPHKIPRETPRRHTTSIHGSKAITNWLIICSII